MLEERFYMFSTIILILTALNTVSSGLFDVSPLNIFNNNIVKFIYIIILISTLYLMFNRNFYLPFLGKTVVPYSLFNLTKPVNPEKDMKSLDVDAKDAVFVIYWAATANTLMKEQTNLTPELAYKDFTNSGTIPVNNNKATIYYKCPVSYSVGLFTNTELPKHVHYRLVYHNGMLSEVKTVNVN